MMPIPHSEFRIPHFDDLIGKPFDRRGRGPEAYDCFGLVIEVRRRLGLPTPDVAYQPDVATDPPRTGAAMAAEIAGDRWTPCGPETGAVVAIRNAPGIVNHCGVVVAPGRFLQILKGVGVHLASLDSPRYRRRIAGYYTCRPGIPGGALHKP